MEAKDNVHLRPPIPEPSAPAVEPGFAPAFWPVMVASLVCYLPLLLIVEFFQISSSPNRYDLTKIILNAVVPCVIVAVSAVLATVIQCMTQRVYVDAKGVRGFNGWGWKRRLKWDEIVRIKRHRFLNLRYLLLYAERGSPVWLPLFLRDMNGSQGAIHSHAPPNHSLRQWLGLPPST